ncbi:alpha/beta hydrolase [Marinomonas transparens]|uniref:Alpha/beta hydrolase n=1 Tax=Marinomonas transparens TaxID=2795388 RepID=A0A934JLU0_9GAMM|nr:alpha/beta hydrolase [Marinomonas transparens]MBJ7538545.1 alpha/beta hydrolase [Marinomonas transparens]
MIEIDCSITSGDVTLMGTACLPEECGQFPVVLMIHGSGPLDRDENVNGQGLNIFNAMAHYLAEQGIASVRYDKRGCGASTGNYYSTGHFALVDDAVEWCNALDGFPFCDKNQKYLLGHSEGCIIAAQADIKSPSIAGLILLCPFIESLEAILKQQAKVLQKDVDGRKGMTKLFLRLFGQPVDLQKKLITKIKNTSSDSFYARFRKVEAKWFREIFTINPVETFQQVTSPILAIAGEKDLQCNPKDVEEIAHIANVEVEQHIIGDLTHILRCDQESASFANYPGLMKKSIEPTVLTIISTWLSNQTGQK